MRLQGQQITVEAAGEISGGNFGISKSDQGHIMVILRDKLYSDKIMAVLREYGTNALDAHKESGLEEPIKVTLPTRFTPTLTIRDYGTGLSEDQIYNVYTQYGRSTKRESDDAIGQLGLGCKSAFAYSQQFMVTSWHGGRKMVFNAYIDPTNEGRMTKLHEEPMKAGDRTGIEIQIPVRGEDIPQFEERAHRCYYYFEPQPAINIKLRAPNYVMKRGWWRIKDQFDRDQNTPVAVMGSIGYPLRKERMGELTGDFRALLETPLEIRFNIGELSISANREDLEYTPHTINSIKQRLAAIVKQFKEEIESKFKEAKTPWEARVLYWNYLQVARGNRQTGYYGHYGRTDFITQLIDRYAAWNGIKLAENSWRDAGKDIAGAKIKWLEHHIAKPTTRSGYEHHVEVKSDTVLFVADVTTAYLQRVLQNRNQKDCLIYVPDKAGEVDQVALDGWLAKYGLTGITTKKLSTLPYNPQIVTTAGTADTTKQNISVFKLATGWTPYTHPKSNNWVAAEVEQADGEGVWVGLYKYIPENDKGVEIDLNTLRRQMDTLTQLGATKLPEIVGVKRKDIADMGPKWETWDKYYAREYERLLHASGIMQDVVDFRTVTSHAADHCYRLTESGYHRQNRLEILGRLLPSGHLVNKLLASTLMAKAALDRLAKSPKNELIRRLSTETELLKTAPASRYDVELLQAQFVAAYPLLRHTSFWTTNTELTQDAYQQFAHYINIVDQVKGET